MKSIFRLIVCLLLLMGWGLAALSLHVIRTADDFPITLITKDRFGITDTYVDTRAWTKDDLPSHTALVEKLIAVGKADVLKHVVPEARPEQVASELSNALISAPTTDPAHTTRPAQPSTAGHGLQGFLGLFTR